MNDATGNTTRDTTDRATRHDIVSVTEAADVLGITPDSVRARLRRGSLAGEKQGTTWMVHLDPSSARDEDGRRATRHDTPRDATRQRDTTARDRPTIDLSPLVNLVERQTAEIQRLTEASTLWQERARTLEQRLLAIEAGAVPVDRDREEAAPEAVESLQASDPGPTGVLAWWRRLWGD